MDFWKLESIVELVVHNGIKHSMEIIFVYQATSHIVRRSTKCIFTFEKILNFSEKMPSESLELVILLHTQY